MANLSGKAVAATGRAKVGGVSVLVLLSRKQREILAPMWAKLAQASIVKRVGRG